MQCGNVAGQSPVPHVNIVENVPTDHSSWSFPRQEQWRKAIRLDRLPSMPTCPTAHTIVVNQIVKIP